MTTMQAAVLYQRGSGVLEIEELEIDEPQAGEVLVRVAASGVCRTDHSVAFGELFARGLGGPAGGATGGRGQAGAGPGAALPLILGHEGAGVVERVGPGVASVQPGDHVILAVVASCGRCFYCTSGHPHLCVSQPRVPPRAHKGEQRYAVFSGVGSFGTYTVMREEAVVPIRKDMPLDRAALIGCGVMTGMGAVINTAKVEPGANVAVIGCGGVGLSAIQAARLSGAYRIIAVDTVSAKLETALGLGATDSVDALKEDVVRRVQELTGGWGADYAFECIGLPVTIRQSYDCVRRGGTAVVVGAGGPEEVGIPAGQLFSTEKILRGSFMGSMRPRIDFPKLVDLSMAGRINLEEMITRRFPLTGVSEAFRAMEQGEVARSVLLYS